MPLLIRKIYQIQDSMKEIELLEFFLIYIKLRAFIFKIFEVMVMKLDIESFYNGLVTKPKDLLREKTRKIGKNLLSFFSKRALNACLELKWF